MISLNSELTNYETVLPLNLTVPVGATLSFLLMIFVVGFSVIFSLKQPHVLSIIISFGMLK